VTQLKLAFCHLRERRYSPLPNAQLETYAIKWRHYKVHFVWQVRKDDPPQKLAIPRPMDLYDNPQESASPSSRDFTGQQ
jgi:hypothetical protein